MTYKNQEAWKQVQEFLPADYHFHGKYQPKEEYWNWQGNQVHLDTFRNAKAPAKVILFHGVGTNGRQISMIMGGPLAKDGFETITVDMPTYGESIVAPNRVISYDDWIQCGSDLIDAELAKDDRPIFLYGLSAGGMETYHVAAKNRKVKGIIGMTFLYQLEPVVRMRTTSNKFWGHFGEPLATLSTKMGLSRFKIKMSIPSLMSALVNDPDCLRIMLDDKTSAGNKVTMKFISSYMNYHPEIAPEDFDICPIILTQPDADRWSPQYLSDLFLDRITKVPVYKTTLTNGSHYPIEESALRELHSAALNFLNDQLENM